MAIQQRTHYEIRQQLRASLCNGLLGDVRLFFKHHFFFFFFNEQLLKTPDNMLIYF